MDADSLQLLFVVGDNVVDRNVEDDAHICAAIRVLDEIMSDDGGIYQARFGVVNRKMMRERADHIADLLREDMATKDETVEYHQLLNCLKYHPKVNTFRFYFGNMNCYFTRPMMIRKWWQFDRMVDDIVRGLRAESEAPERRNGE